MDIQTNHPNHPNHYVQAAGKLEPIDLCRLFPFCFGNFCKYVLRAPYKGQEVTDLQKAAQYLEWAQDELPQFEDKLRSYAHLMRCFNNPWLNMVLNNSDFKRSFPVIVQSLRERAMRIQHPKKQGGATGGAIKLSGVLMARNGVAELP